MVGLALAASLLGNAAQPPPVTPITFGGSVTLAYTFPCDTPVSLKQATEGVTFSADNTTAQLVKEAGSERMEPTPQGVVFSFKIKAPYIYPKEDTLKPVTVGLTFPQGPDQPPCTLAVIQRTPPEVELHIGTGDNNLIMAMAGVRYHTLKLEGNNRCVIFTDFGAAYPASQSPVSSLMYPLATGESEQILPRMFYGPSLDYKNPGLFYSRLEIEPGTLRVIVLDHPNLVERSLADMPGMYAVLPSGGVLATRLYMFNALGDLESYRDYIREGRRLYRVVQRHDVYVGPETARKLDRLYGLDRQPSWGVQSDYFTERFLADAFFGRHPYLVMNLDDSIAWTLIK